MGTINDLDDVLWRLLVIVNTGEKEKFSGERKRLITKALKIIRTHIEMKEVL